MTDVAEDIDPEMSTTHTMSRGVRVTPMQVGEECTGKIEERKGKERKGKEKRIRDIYLQLAGQIHAPKHPHHLPFLCCVQLLAVIHLWQGVCCVVIFEVVLAVVTAMAAEMAAELAAEMAVGIVVSAFVASAVVVVVVVAEQACFVEQL